jgi:tRNA(fMet)-specific endonuclease VapC
MKLMLDTSAYSAFKRGQLETVTAIRRAEQILLSATVFGELLAGFETGTQTVQNKEMLREFISSPRVDIVLTGLETAERYARIYAYLRSEGRPIPTNDLWIAASAMEHSAELLTLDTHFQKIPQIVVHLVSS